MSRSCYECTHFERPALDSPDHGIRGKCGLAKKRYGGELAVGWGAPACKGFESKLTGQRPGRKYQGVRRTR